MEKWKDVNEVAGGNMSACQVAFSGDQLFLQCSIAQSSWQFQAMLNSILPLHGGNKESHLDMEDLFYCSLSCALQKKGNLEGLHNPSLFVQIQDHIANPHFFTVVWHKDCLWLLMICSCKEIKMCGWCHVCTKWSQVFMWCISVLVSFLNPSFCNQDNLIHAKRKVSRSVSKMLSQVIASGFA